VLYVLATRNVRLPAALPEAQGSLPIVALLLYARGDGSLTYVPSLSHYRCEQRDQGGTDVQRGPARDLRPGAGNGRACAQARQEATRTAELLDRSVTQTGRTLSEGPRRTCQVFVGGHNSQFRLCVYSRVHDTHFLNSSLSYTYTSLSWSEGGEGPLATRPVARSPTPSVLNAASRP